MVKATFEHEGNYGLLSVTTHFGRTVNIPCVKQDDETFRLGGTAAHTVTMYEGLVLKFLVKYPESKGPSVVFRAFKNEHEAFEGYGHLSPEEWTKANLHCYVTEYYPLDMEGKKPSWFLSQEPLKNANHLFINLDIIDALGNVLRRYRVSPFTGEYKIMDGLNG